MIAVCVRYCALFALLNKNDYVAGLTAGAGRCLQSPTVMLMSRGVTA